MHYAVAWPPDELSEAAGRCAGFRKARDFSEMAQTFTAAAAVTATTLRAA